MLDTYIKESISDVFSTMIMMDVTPGKTITSGYTDFKADISSMIGLAGDIKGMLALHLPYTVARSITGSMLGMDTEDVENEDVTDAIGEIANMVAGGFKTFFTQGGKQLLLSTPTIISGSDLKTSGMSKASSFVIPLAISSGEFTVELKYVQE